MDQNQLDTTLFDIDNIPVLFVDLHINCGIMEGNATTSSLVQNEVKMYNKIVSYSSSTESENHDDRKISHNTKELKRFDPDYSFYGEKDSNHFNSGSDSEQLNENHTNTVGEASLEKI
ncbi:hypothetical protein JTB14_004263 [Gonioctena quinquepunctata]|nr:hypothetical protein JTB14_004263 [Gonioctena quinquepunctata]